MRHNGQVTRIGEGSYCGFVSYPSLTMKPKGGFIGLTNISVAGADRRVVDLYRCADGKLA